MHAQIKAAYPFPTERPDFVPFMWKLDGGGRELVINLLDHHNITMMVEIGVLYGGSALQWLDHKLDLTVIGIDPWEFNSEQVRYWWNNRYAYGINNLNQGGLSDDQFLHQLLKVDAAYEATLSNLWDYRDRFVPVRGRSPDVLYKLRGLGLSPDLIYFDSDKDLSDLWISNDLWPHSLLAGDDWSWTPEDQPDLYPVQIAVKKFAAERNMTIRSSGATWCLI